MVRYDDVGRWRDFEQENTCINVLERSRGMDGAGGFKGQPWRSLVGHTSPHPTLTTSLPTLTPLALRGSLYLGSLSSRWNGAR